MRQLPALFSTPMVQAILEDRKTMTRRTTGLEIINGHPDLYYLSGVINGTNSFVFKMTVNVMEIPDIYITSRYQVGDHIWVREKFETETDGTVKFYAGNIEVEHNTAYRQLTKWKTSIRMPKEAARIWLECTRVRCERLMDITEDDAIAEGVSEFGSLTKRYVDYCPENHYTKDELKSGYVFETTAVYSFLTLWESMNGIESVRLNPWVFIYEFKRIENP